MVNTSIYLLDTNILSEPVRPNPSSNVMQKFRVYETDIATSSVVLHELRYGWLKMPDGAKKQLIGDYVKDVVGSLPCFNYDQQAARVHAEIRASLEKKGISLPFVDSQIASVAIANGLILVTRNIRDFQKIPGVRLENWFE